MSAREDFINEFYEEEFEILFLAKDSCSGAMLKEDIYIPSIEFFACVDMRTGELLQEKGRLEWMVDNNKNRKNWGYDFKQFGIYYIRVRECIPKVLKPYQSKVLNNRYMVVQLMEEKPKNEGLEKLQAYYSEPVVIGGELGKFILDRTFSWFEGTVDWNGTSCTVVLETDMEDGDSADLAFQKFKELSKDLIGWDRKFREFAAEKLTQYVEYDENEEGAVEITKELFAERIKISNLAISPDGSMELYYNDGNMFGGHEIEIFANTAGEIVDAATVG